MFIFFTLLQKSEYSPVAAGPPPYDFNGGDPLTSAYGNYLMQPGTPSRPVTEFTDIGGASAAMSYSGTPYPSGERTPYSSRLMDYTPMNEYESQVSPVPFPVSTLPGVGYGAINGRPSSCYNNSPVIPPNTSQVIVGNPEYVGSITPTSHHHGSSEYHAGGETTTTTTTATTPTRDSTASTDSNHNEQYYYFRSCNSAGSVSSGGTTYLHNNGNQQGHHHSLNNHVHHQYHHSQQQTGAIAHFQNFASHGQQGHTNHQYGNAMHGSNTRHPHQQYPHSQQYHTIHHHQEYGSASTSPFAPTNSVAVTPPHNNNHKGSPTGASLNLSQLSDNTNDSSGSSSSCCGSTHSHRNSSNGGGGGGSTPGGGSDVAATAVVTGAATTPTELVAIGATTEMVSSYPGYTSVIVDPHRLTDYDCVNCS